jgi:hypothetical protein
MESLFKYGVFSIIKVGLPISLLFSNTQHNFYVWSKALSLGCLISYVSIVFNNSNSFPHQTYLSNLLDNCSTSSSVILLILN